jgi:hypothetical protein
MYSSISSSDIHSLLSASTGLLVHKLKSWETKEGNEEEEGEIWNEKRDKTYSAYSASTRLADSQQVQRQQPYGRDV